MMHLPTRPPYREQTHPNRKMFASDSKAGESEPFEPFETKVPDTRHRATGAVVCLARFWSWFAPAFPYYTPFPFPPF